MKGLSIAAVGLALVVVATLLAVHGSSVRAQPAASIALPAPRGTVQLYPGCNNVALSFPDGTASQTVVQAVTPSGVVQAMWRHNAAHNRFEGFSPAAPQASDLLMVNLWDAVWLCLATVASPPTATPLPPTPIPPPPTPTPVPQPLPPVPGNASAKEAYPLALQAARATRPDAYLDHASAGCSSWAFGGLCFERAYHEMASGDGRSKEWTFFLYSAAAHEDLSVHVQDGRATEPYVYPAPPPLAPPFDAGVPGSLPLDEMIDSTEAVRVADAHGGNAYKAGRAGGRLCGARISSVYWQIDYCPPFDPGGTGLAVFIDARTGEVTKTEESRWR